MASEIQSSITINRPIEDVFAVLTNVENTEKWFPGNVKEWWTSAAPHGVGSTRRARVKMGLMTTENDAVTTLYEPPHRAGMKSTSKRAPFEAMLSFAPVADGTEVHVKIEMFLRGPVRLFGGPFARWYGDSWDKGLVNLKRMMEAGEL